MHDTVLEFGKYAIDTYKLNQGSVLEIGSQNVNGSLRQYFTDVDEYIGTDIVEGNGVDIVCSSHDLLHNTNFIHVFGDGYEYRQFDTIVCTEMLEHDPAFWKTLNVISYLLKPNGYLILTARGARPNGEAMFEHSYPWDYWRFMPQSVPELLKLADCITVMHEDDTQHPGFLALGRKCQLP